MPSNKKTTEIFNNRMDVTLILITLTRPAIRVMFGDLSYRPQRLNTNLLIFGLEVRLAVRISNNRQFQLVPASELSELVPHCVSAHKTKYLSVRKRRIATNVKVARKVRRDLQPWVWMIGLHPQAKFKISICIGHRRQLRCFTFLTDEDRNPLHSYAGVVRYYSTADKK